MKNILRKVFIAGAFLFTAQLIFALDSSDKTELSSANESSVSAVASENNDNQFSEIPESENDSSDDTSMEGFDDLFESAEDTGAVVTESIEQKVEQEVKDPKKGVIFSGNLNTRIGAKLDFYPFDGTPGAIFESLLTFSSHPKDYFSFKGSLLMAFPEIANSESNNIGVYELFCNYTLFNTVYLTIGKKLTTWGSGKVFDTNILDDNNGVTVDPNELLYEKELDVNKPKFTIGFSIPFWHFNFSALAMYDIFYEYKKIWVTDARNPSADPQQITVSMVAGDGKLSLSNLYFAGRLEANIWKFSVALFGRTWAPNDPHRYNPVAGIDLNFNLGDLHAYLQYMAHVRRANDGLQFPRMKGTASFWWATTDKIDLGFCVEYQIIYDWYSYSEFGEPKGKIAYEYVQHYIAFEALWHHINDSKFSLGVKTFHNFKDISGQVIPAVTMDNLIPDTSIEIGFPVKYTRSGVTFGTAFQIKLNINY